MPLNDRFVRDQNNNACNKVTERYFNCNHKTQSFTAQSSFSKAVNFLTRDNLFSSLSNSSLYIIITKCWCRLDFDCLCFEIGGVFFDAYIEKQQFQESVSCFLFQSLMGPPVFSKEEVQVWRISSRDRE